MKEMQGRFVNTELLCQKWRTDLEGNLGLPLLGSLHGQLSQVVLMWSASPSLPGRIVNSQHCPAFGRGAVSLSQNIQFLYGRGPKGRNSRALLPKELPSQQLFAAGGKWEIPADSWDKVLYGLRAPHLWKLTSCLVLASKSSSVPA